MARRFYRPPPEPLGHHTRLLNGLYVARPLNDRSGLSESAVRPISQWYGTILPRAPHQSAQRNSSGYFWPLGLTYHDIKEHLRCQLHVLLTYVKSGAPAWT